MALFSFGKRFEPVCDFVETFLTGILHHARIHVGIFMRFAGDGCLQVLDGIADGLAGRRIANFLKKLEMTMRVTGFTFGR